MSLNGSMMLSMAWIRKRKTSTGDVRYDVGYRVPDGRVRRETFRRSEDARRFAANVETELQRGAWIDPRLGQVTLREYATGWLDLRPAPLRQRTRENYEGILERHIFPTLGSVELGKITPSLIRHWHGRLTGAAATRAKTYRLLRSILATAVDDELLARNPCHIDGAGVERAAERPSASIEQVCALADVVEPRYRALVLTAGLGGLRLGELLGLRRRHVNVLHRELVVEQQEQELASGRLVLGPPKTDAGIRRLTLPDELVEELEDHLAAFCDAEPDARVFTGPRGGPLRRKVWQGHWNAARAQVELPAGFRFHDLRHTANTLTAATSASTRELMARMGHRSSAAALRYQHATRQRDQAIADELGSIVAAARSPRDAKAAGDS